MSANSSRRNGRSDQAQGAMWPVDKSVWLRSHRFDAPKNAWKDTASPDRANRQEDVAVLHRARYMLSVAMGLCLAHSLPAQQPSQLRIPAAAPQTTPTNQQIA